MLAKEQSQITGEINQTCYTRKLKRVKEGEKSAAKTLSKTEAATHLEESKEGDSKEKSIIDSKESHRLVSPSPTTAERFKVPDKNKGSTKIQHLFSRRNFTSIYVRAVRKPQEIQCPPPHPYGTMSSKIKKTSEGLNSIQLEIPEKQPEGSTALETHWGSYVYEPRNEFVNPTPTGSNDSSNRQGGYPAPEKKLTLFALRLAVLEKTASGLGKLAFVWATVVLLGGFAVTLESKDFVFVTVILLIEGTRIFSRSHELEWQHQATKTPVGRYSLRRLVTSSRSLFQGIKLLFQPFLVAGSSRRLTDDARVAQQQQLAQINNVKYTARQRTWHASDVPILPNFGWVFVSKNVSRVLVWLQYLSATACIVLSLMRLIQQDYGLITDRDSETKNRKPALNIFYALALTEALLFLLEKTYWEWKVNYCKLLEQVCKDCDLWEHSGLLSIKRFFYDAYFSCINGSIFDGLKMDLVSFAKELLDSDSSEEQLIGAHILQKFTTDNRFTNDTLRKIGSSTSVMERLIEMLSWKKSDEEEIRKSAADIISKLAGKNRSALQVASIIGAMESISSLLYTGRRSGANPQEVYQRSIIADQAEYSYSVFNLLGLLILKKLASDHDNCGKIGSSRGLLAKIIDFTSAGKSLLRNDFAPESQIKAVRRSLQLVKRLVSTTGNTGKMLRKDISEIVFTVSNIRDILQYGENHMVLQKLGVEIIISLAMDEDAKEKIGRTGGVIKLLLIIFFRPRVTKDQDSLSIEAGEALAMLALESKMNCNRILREKNVVEQFVGTLDDLELRVNSSRILRNLCAYAGTENSEHLRGVTTAAPTVLNTIMIEKDKLLEVSVGLATQIFRFTGPKKYSEELRTAGFRDTEFADKLVQILKAYNYPEIKVPRIRLYVIELSIQMMRDQEEFIWIFKRMYMEEALECVAETTSELESFNAFSGSVGISRHKTPISTLVETALELMNKG